MSEKERNRLNSILKLAKRDIVFPFAEKPSEEKNLKATGKPNSLDAFGLFSLFTADIIKEEVIFTR